MANSPRYGTNNQNTSKYVSDLLNEFNKMPRGVFNNTRRKVFDAPIGYIVPFECWEMLPNSELYVSHDVQLLSKNPTIKRLLSSMSVEVAYYKVRYQDCWRGWNNFITKGRSGRVFKNLPLLDFYLSKAHDNNAYVTVLPYNPCHYLSICPAECLSSASPFSFSLNTGISRFGDLGPTGLTGLSAGVLTSAGGISALPFVMYNKIAKHYMTANLMQDNPHWFPENEDDDNVLPYNCPQYVRASTFADPGVYYSAGDPVQPNAVKEEDGSYKSYPWLNVLWAAQRKGDYFNTGSPFPDLIRGDVPTLEVLGASIKDGVFDFTGTVFNAGTNVSTGFVGLDLVNRAMFAGKIAPSSASDVPYLVAGDNDYSNALRDALNRGRLSSATISGLNFSMSQWRYLATMTVMKERLALTDGSYNEMIKAMFGHDPEWHGPDVTYCGGFTQPIVFSEVVNTTAGDAAPLGDTAGRAVSSSQNKTVHIKSDDFGMYMAVLVIKTDEYYSQGIDKMWSRITNAEQYFPILNNLSPDYTANKELFISGDAAVDNAVFNYQERFAYYKSRRNQVSGLMALPVSKVGDIGAYIQNRLFSATPQFNSEFSRYQLTDNEKAIFAVSDQAEFICSVGCQMKYIAPIPEDSRPSDMGISY